MKFLKQFILENQSLIHLDLAGTSLDDNGIYELVQLLKKEQDECSESEPHKLRNLAGLHLSCKDPNTQPTLVKKINDLLSPPLQMRIESHSDEEDSAKENNEAEQTSELELNKKLAQLKAPFSSQDKDTKSFKA